MRPIHLLVALLSLCSAARLRYVLPNESSPPSCPGQPCLTMEQYAELAGTYIISGSIFTFLHGSHGLESDIRLTNISDLTLRGEGNGTLSIIRSYNTLLLDGASNVRIKGLAFSFHSTSSTSMVLNITSSNNIKIILCAFQTYIQNHTILIFFR